MEKLKFEFAAAPCIAPTFLKILASGAVGEVELIQEMALRSGRLTFALYYIGETLKIILKQCFNGLHEEIYLRKQGSCLLCVSYSKYLVLFTKCAFY